MKNIALTLFSIIGLVFLSLGSVYLLSNEFMSYHAAAIETPWNQLNSNYQGLTLGGLRGLGAGAFCVGLMLIALSVLSFLRGLAAYKLLLITTSIVYSSLLAYAIYTVRSLTPGEPSLGVIVVIIVCSFIASGLALIADDDN
jgi:hypothetical protein